MTLRSDLRSDIATRLGDITNAIWTVPELNGYIDKAIKSLYPTYFILESGVTLGSTGPLQNMPAGARNLYAVGVMAVTATRVRTVRQWREGINSTLIPTYDLTGFLIVWSWTMGFTSPGDDVTTLDLLPECEEVVVLRASISAIERILSDRVSAQKYFALTVREGTTEQDLVQTLDALHASLQNRLSQATKLPERVG